jgi:transcriptional regulator with PAS, ATPase and Fis domain
VVITGESGTGKELVARALHFEGPRSAGQFVAENCAALSESLLESELFGYARGAFTGAVQSKKGLFEVADGGTLLLDEIAETSPGVQTKLLRVLEAGEMRRLGETEARKVDVRLLAATSRDLRLEVEEGRFRPELFYRLNVLNVDLPTLRDKREDIPLLAQHFLEDYARRTGKELPGFSREVIAALCGMGWPGNVRELKNEVERMAAMVEAGKTIQMDLISKKVEQETGVSAGRRPGESMNEALQRTKREMIEEALEEAGGNRTRAAELLGTTRTNLQMIMKRSGMQ